MNCKNLILGMLSAKSVLNDDEKMNNLFDKVLTNNRVIWEILLYNEVMIFINEIVKNRFTCHSE